jgi:hypothetical protein
MGSSWLQTSPSRFDSTPILLQPHDRSLTPNRSSHLKYRDRRGGLAPRTWLLGRNLAFHLSQNAVGHLNVT